MIFVFSTGPSLSSYFLVDFWLISETFGIFNFQRYRNKTGKAHFSEMFGFHLCCQLLSHIGQLKQLFDKKKDVLLAVFVLPYKLTNR